MTVFFRYFFRERQKDNEINALHSTQNGLYDPLYRENRSFGISCHTPAVSGAFPPCQIHHARRCVRPFPLAHHETPARAGVSSPSPLMEIGQGWNERTQSERQAFHDGNAQTRANGAFALLMQKKRKKNVTFFFDAMIGMKRRA